MDKKYRPTLIILGWISLGILGIFLLSIGISSFFYEILTNYRISTKIIFSIIGIILIVFSAKNSIFQIIKGVSKNSLNGNISRNDISNIIYRERILSK